VIIDKGRIVAEDTESGLAAKLAGERRIAVRVARPDVGFAAALTAVSGVLDVFDDGDGLYRIDTGQADLREAVAGAVVDGGFGLLEMREEVASLEQIYLRLVGAGAGIAGISGGGEDDGGEGEVTA
jgi:hypothetical protein